MDTQLTLFDLPTAPQINTVPPTSCKIIQFPGTSAVEPPKKVNYRKGEEQTVFPIKSREQLDAMASWLRANADPDNEGTYQKTVGNSQSSFHCMYHNP